MPKSSEQIADALSRQVLRCMDSREDREGHLEVRMAIYKHESGQEFCGLHFAPGHDNQPVSLNITHLLGIFDKSVPPSCLFGNYEKTKDGVNRTPHLRIMGTYRGLLVMINVYMQPVQFEEA